MLEINLHPFPVINTERLTLRQTSEADVPEVFFLRSDKEVRKYIEKQACQSADEALQHIRLLNNMWKDNEGISWAVTLKGEDKMIGNIGIWNIQREHYRAELGYALYPKHQGKGIMSEAMKAVIDYAFNKMKLHSLEANVNPDNAASIAVLKKSGFVQEALFKEHFYYNGVFYDSAIFSLLNTAS